MSPRREKNVVFSSLLLKLTNIFGIIPHYDSTRQMLRHTVIFKLYGLFLATLTTTVTFIAFHEIQEDSESVSQLLGNLQILLVIISMLTFLVIVLGSSMLNMKRWERMFNLLAPMDCYGKGTRSCLKFENIFLVAGSFPAFCFFVFMWNFKGIIYSWSVFALYVTRHITICIAYAIISLLRKVYGAIDDVLVNVKHRTVIKSSTVTNLQDLRKSYVEADKIVDSFNDIFGWPLLFLHAEAVLVLVFFLAVMTQEGLKPPVEELRSSEVIALQAIYSVMFLSGPTLIIFTCDIIVQETNRLLKKCYKMCEILPLLASEREELERLRNLIQNRTPKFTAANFFEIKRSTFLSLIGVVTTYMIVVLQYNYL